jgi:hypothetical protein
MTDTKSPLRIDIVSDVMCPWCIIGYRQLAAALEASDVDHEIHWHPFELNPNMPSEGQDIGEHLAEKYGTTPEQSLANRAMMTARGKEFGFEFNFADGFRMHNTFNTHQLLHWANEQLRKNDLKQALSRHCSPHISQTGAIYLMMQCWSTSRLRSALIVMKQQPSWPTKGLRAPCVRSSSFGPSRALAAFPRLSLIGSI